MKLTDVELALFGSQSTFQRLKSFGALSMASPVAHRAGVSWSLTNNKWYAWRHRKEQHNAADIMGFGIGDTRPYLIMPEDCRITNPSDLQKAALDYWRNEDGKVNHSLVTNYYIDSIEHNVVREDVKGMLIRMQEVVTCGNVQAVENRKIFYAYPDDWTFCYWHWKVSNLEQARNLAEQFAKGIC